MPEDVNKLLSKGQKLVDTGRWKKALKVFERVTSRNPNEWTGWLWRGRILIALGRLYEAIEVLETAIKLAPDCAEAWIEKGRAYLFCERYESADVCFKKVAVELVQVSDRFSALAHSGLAIVLAHQGKDAIALKHVDRAIELDSQDRGFRAQKFFLLEKMRKIDDGFKD